MTGLLKKTPDRVVDPEVLRVRAVIRRLRYRPDYWFVVGSSPVGVYLELEHSRRDADTGLPGTGHGGRRYITPGSTDSEIIRLALGAALSYEEHEVREFFLVDGARVFGPHIDVDALIEVAGRVDFRPKPATDSPVTVDPDIQGYRERARQALLALGEDPNRVVYAQDEARS